MQKNEQARLNKKFANGVLNSYNFLSINVNIEERNFLWDILF